MTGDYPIAVSREVAASTPNEAGCTTSLHLGHGTMTLRYFAPAGAEHRFEEFSEDFATWVVFWGPKGGEK